MARPLLASSAPGHLSKCWIRPRGLVDRLYKRVALADELSDTPIATPIRIVVQRMALSQNRAPLYYAAFSLADMKGDTDWDRRITAMAPLGRQTAALGHER